MVRLGQRRVPKRRSMLLVTSYNRIHDVNMTYHWWLNLIKFELAGFLRSQVTFSLFQHSDVWNQL